MTCFRVFRTSMIMLDIISLVNLMPWETFVEKLTRTCPSCWGLRSHEQDLGEDQARGGPGRSTAPGMGPQQTMGHGLQQGPKKRRVLDGPGPPTSDGLGVQRRKRLSTTSSRLGGRQPDEGREAVLSLTYGGQARSHFRDEGEEQSKKRQQEEEESGRSRRTPPIQSQRKDFKRWRSGRRKERFVRFGRRLFRLEQRERPVRRSSPGEACKAPVPRRHRCTICGSPGHPSKSCPQKRS